MSKYPNESEILNPIMNNIIPNIFLSFFFFSIYLNLLDFLNKKYDVKFFKCF